jgi:hypothetical protein
MYTVYYTKGDSSSREPQVYIFVSGVSSAALAARIADQLMDDFKDVITEAWADQD